MFIHALNMGVRFLLELCALGALIYWGFNRSDDWLMKLLLGIGIPLLAAAIWGIFRVPNDPGDAPIPIPGWLRLLLEFILFAGATLALSAAGQTTLAWIFGIAILIHYQIDYKRVLWLIKQ